MTEKQRRAKGYGATHYVRRLRDGSGVFKHIGETKFTEHLDRTVDRSIWQKDREYPWKWEADYLEAASQILMLRGALKEIARLAFEGDAHDTGYAYDIRCVAGQALEATER